MFIRSKDCFVLYILFVLFCNVFCVQHKFISLLTITGNNTIDNYIRLRSKQRNTLYCWYYSECLAKQTKKKKRFRNRNRKKKKNFTNVPWAQMLSDPLTQDPTTREGKFFRRRFRIPYPIFLRIVDVVRQKEWFSDSYKSG